MSLYTELDLKKEEIFSLTEPIDAFIKTQNCIDEPACLAAEALPDLAIIRKPEVGYMMPKSHKLSNLNYSYRCMKVNRFTKRRPKHNKQPLYWCFSHPQIGCQIAKTFRVGMRNVLFKGVVTKVANPSSKHKQDELFHVVYDDQDEEDFDAKELMCYKDVFRESVCCSKW